MATHMKQCHQCNLVLFSNKRLCKVYKYMNQRYLGDQFVSNIRIMHHINEITPKLTKATHHISDLTPKM